MDKLWYNLFYITLICVDLAQYEIFVLKFAIMGKDDIICPERHVEIDLFDKFGINFLMASLL